MKITALLVSAILFLFGLVLNNFVSSLLGAALYILVNIIDLFVIYKLAKSYRNENLDPEKELNPNKYLKITEELLSGIILFSGLIAFMINKNYDLNYLPGAIIWGGSIIVYFIYGIIIRHVTNIPIRWGYGGWSKSWSYIKKRNNFIEK